MKLNTVNVIEVIDEIPRALHSFTDDAAGNAEAESTFRKICQDNEVPSEEDINMAIETGHITNGTWELFLVHSEPPTA